MKTRTGRVVFASLLLTVVSAGQIGCQRSLLAIRQSGDYAYSRGEYDKAQAEYQEYLARSPGRPEVHHMLGRTYMAQGKTAQAREQLLLAQRISLSDDTIFESTCEGLYADKQYDELMKLLRQRTFDRGQMKDYLLLARYSERLGDKDEAQRALITAARVDGGMSIEPQLELAKLYISTGDTQRAKERLGNAYFIDPRNGEVTALAARIGAIIGPTFAVAPPERVLGPQVPIQNSGPGAVVEVNPDGQSGAGGN